MSKINYFDLFTSKNTLKSNDNYTSKHSVTSRNWAGDCIFYFQSSKFIIKNLLILL